jgi:hypothetical protein
MMHTPVEAHDTQCWAMHRLHGCGGGACPVHPVAVLNEKKTLPALVPLRHVLGSDRAAHVGQQLDAMPRETAFQAAGLQSVACAACSCGCGIQMGRGWRGVCDCQRLTGDSVAGADRVLFAAVNLGLGMGIP